MDVVDYSDDEEFLGGGLKPQGEGGVRLGSSQRGGRRHIGGSASSRDGQPMRNLSASSGYNCSSMASQRRMTNLGDKAVALTPPIPRPKPFGEHGADNNNINDKINDTINTNKDDDPRGLLAPQHLLQRPSFAGFVPKMNTQFLAEPILPLLGDYAQAIDCAPSDLQHVAVSPAFPVQVATGRRIVAMSMSANATALDGLPSAQVDSVPVGDSIASRSARQIHYRNDALRQAVGHGAGRARPPQTLHPSTAPADDMGDLTEEDRRRHKAVLLKRQVLGANSLLMHGGSEGDVMRRGVGVGVGGSVLNVADTEAREVLGLNIQPRAVATSVVKASINQPGAAGHVMVTYDPTLPAGVNGLDPAAVGKFRKKSRHLRGMESVEARALRQQFRPHHRGDAGDFTSSSSDNGDVDAVGRGGDHRVVTSDGTELVQLSLKESARQAKRAGIRADVELTLRQYRVEHRSLPDEGGRVQTIASNGIATTSQRPFAAVQPTPIDGLTLLSAPKSTRPGGGAFGGHMTFAASIFAVLFCVKIKGCLGHETRDEIQRAFDKEAMSGDLKRLKALENVSLQALLIPPVAPGPAVDGQSAHHRPSSISYATAQGFDPVAAGGGFVTPRNVGGGEGRPLEKLPPALTRRKPQHSLRRRVARRGEEDIEDGSDAGGSTSPEGSPLRAMAPPPITARGALLTGRQRFAEMKKIISNAVNASTQRMQHAKKQHCTSQTARALAGEGGSGDVCGGHHHLHHQHARDPETDPYLSVPPSPRANPFRGAGAGGGAKALGTPDTAQLSEFLFDDHARGNNLQLLESTQKANTACISLMGVGPSSAPGSMIPKPPPLGKSSPMRLGGRNQLSSRAEGQASTDRVGSLSIPSLSHPNGMGGGFRVSVSVSSALTMGTPAAAALSTVTPPSQGVTAGKGGTVPGQRDFYVLHNGWVDFPFSPPALVQAADYVPQARESKLRTFTRPESPLLPVIERLGPKPALRAYPTSKKNAVVGGGDSFGKKKGILRKSVKDDGPNSQSDPMVNPLSLGKETAPATVALEAPSAKPASPPRPRGYLQGTATTVGKQANAPNPHNKDLFPPKRPNGGASLGVARDSPPAGGRATRPRALTSRLLMKHNKGGPDGALQSPLSFSEDGGGGSADEEVERAQRMLLLSQPEAQHIGKIRFSDDALDESPTKRAGPILALPRLSVPGSPKVKGVAFSPRKPSAAGAAPRLKLLEPASARMPPKEKFPTKGSLSARGVSATDEGSHGLSPFVRPSGAFVFGDSSPPSHVGPPSTATVTDGNGSTALVGRSRANSVASNASASIFGGLGGVMPSYAHHTFSSRRNSIASNRSFVSNRSGGTSLSGGGALGGGVGSGLGGGFEDLAARKPHGKSQVEAQREMIKDHKKKRASYIDHKTNLHIQWRKETVAERIAKDYDYTMGATNTFEAFRTAKIIDHNSFLARATEEMRRVLKVREETSFPIKARTLVAAVENVEKSRLRQIRKERRHRKGVMAGGRGSDGDVGSDLEDDEDAVPFDVSAPFSARPAKRNPLPEIDGEALRTVDPSVSVASAIRSVEAVISDAMRESQLAAVKAYNSLWVDRVRLGILPYTDDGGFTAEEEKVFTAFKNYLVTTGGTTGVSGGGGCTSPRGGGSGPRIVDGVPQSNQHLRRASTSSAAGLPTVTSSSSLRHLIPQDPTAVNHKLFRKVLNQNFSPKVLESPNIQFLIMRMLPLFPGLTQDDVVTALRDRHIPFHLVTGEFEAIFSPYVVDADDAHRRLKEKRIDRHLAFHANVSRKFDRVERLVRAEKGL